MNLRRFLCHRRGHGGRVSGGSGSRGLRRRRFGRFRGGLGAFRAEMRAHLVRVVVFERARVRALVSDSQLGKVLNDRLAFDFQFPRQIVDSNLTHFPSFFPLHYRPGLIPL